ncbi:MAG: adenylate/guanylate cyclase domain-containing protein, partial [Pseudomonadota bacterium]
MHDMVTKWLTSLGLSHYASAFHEHGIDIDVLPDIDHDTLKDIGINRVGDRMRLIKAASLLESVTSAEVPVKNNRNGPKAEKDSITAERRQLTIMFCDLVGSTEISSMLDPEDLRHIISLYHDKAGPIVRRFEGHVAQYLGDGMLVYFGYPNARELAPQRAVHAALNVISALEQIRNQLIQKFSVDITVRIGIHTGPVVVGEIGNGGNNENLALGKTPNLAARLQGIADPNQCVVSAETKQLLRDQFDLIELGPQKLKGIEKPVNSYAVSGVKHHETVFQATHESNSNMVGREQELDILLARWGEASSGKGNLVLITGEAGIGKSRILNEFEKVIRMGRHSRRVFQCSPHSKDVTLFPVSQEITYASRAQSVDTDDTKKEKLISIIRSRFAKSKSAQELIGPLLGLGYAQSAEHPSSYHSRREDLIELLLGELINLASCCPAMVAIEDAHWADPTTEELLEKLLDKVDQHRILIIVSARPESQKMFGSHKNVTKLSLNRLSRDAAANIVKITTGGKSLPEHLVERITAKTDGNPLYVEECTKTLISSGDVIEINGEYVVSQKTLELSVPASLHDSLMSQLDRLGNSKLVAQIAACIGREFEYSTILSVSGFERYKLECALSKLQQAGLLICTDRPPNTHYIFKHALIRDTAYDSLLFSNRVTVHGRIANVLKTNFNSPPALVAAHYEQANAHSQAFSFWISAAETELNSGSSSQAVAHYRSALRMTNHMGDGLEEEIFDAKLKLGLCLQSAEGYGSTESVEYWDIFSREYAKDRDIRK